MASMVATWWIVAFLRSGSDEIQPEIIAYNSSIEGRE